MSRIPKFASKAQTTDEVPDMPFISKRPNTNLRRSKSLTDVKNPLKVFSAASTFASSSSSALKKSSTNLFKGPVNSTANLKKKPNMIIEKSIGHRSAVKPTGTKRAAENTGTEVKNKVSRRVPDWDFKTRFGILNDKHSSLLANYKDMEGRLSEFNEMVMRCEDLSQENSRLQDENKNAILRMNNLRVKNDELQERLIETDKIKKEKEDKEISLTLLNEELKNKIEQLEIEKQSAAFHTDCIKKEFDILTENYEKCCQRLMEQTEKIKELNNEIFDAEKLRRKLHNYIQDIKGNIRVFCRLRPPLTEQETFYQSNFNFLNDKTVEISRCRGSILPSGSIKVAEKQEFTLDKVFDQNTRQDEIFEELSQLIQSALDGYHVCVLAYGQTGSGKTYTMQGGMDPEQLGMIPRSIDLIFNTIEKMKKNGWSYKVSASFLEIYNENIQDLLDMNSGKSLEIRFNEGKGTTVSNLSIVPISSAEELTKNMVKAQQNRATAVTNFNEHSSRSHAVTKVYIEARYQEGKATFIGSVSLVDLAGSESAKSSTAERLNETKSINKSLSCLGTVMLALHKNDSHIPFRNSKLTYLLQSSLGGNCKCLMIVNVSPSEDCYSETINTLRFAAKVKEVKTASSKNKISNANNS